MTTLTRCRTVEDAPTLITISVMLLQLTAVANWQLSEPGWLELDRKHRASSGAQQQYKSTRSHVYTPA
jgi:hypothetical protein